MKGWYNTDMKAGTKFAVGAVLIVGAVGYLMASGIRQTGQYFLTPTELAQRVSADPSFYDLGMKVGARVVPGTVEKEIATQTLRFHVTDGTVPTQDLVATNGVPADAPTVELRQGAREPAGTRGQVR